MKKLLFIFTLILFGVVSISCSSSDDEVQEPYKEFSIMPNTILGTWKYKVSGAENIDAVLTFYETTSNKEPIMNIKINQYNYSGKPYYPSTGGDGGLYFKLEGKNTYSKISYKVLSSNVIIFKIENVESYTIEKMFQKS